MARVVQPLTLMTTGLYNEPAAGTCFPPFCSNSGI